MILDRKGKFVIEGYRAAGQAKKSRSSKADENYGAKGTRQGNPKQVFFGKRLKKLKYQKQAEIMSDYRNSI